MSSFIPFLHTLIITTIFISNSILPSHSANIQCTQSTPCTSTTVYCPETDPKCIITCKYGIYCQNTKIQATHDKWRSPLSFSFSGQIDTKQQPASKIHKKQAKRHVQPIEEKGERAILETISIISLPQGSNTFKDAKISIGGSQLKSISFSTGRMDTYQKRKGSFRNAVIDIRGIYPFFSPIETPRTF